MFYETTQLPVFHVAERGYLRKSVLDRNAQKSPPSLLFKVIWENKEKQQHMDNIYSSLPSDILFNILSFLSARDTCVVGSCSKFSRALCDTDSIWFSLAIQRWPSLNLPANSQIQHDCYSAADPLLCFKGWKKFYITRHSEVAAGACAVVEFVEKCSASAPLEARDYLKALGDVRSLHLDFKDVELLLFNPKLNVLLHLLGLHYCIDALQVPLNHVAEALQRCEIGERQVLVKWWRGLWMHGFCLRDESHYRFISMADLAAEKHPVLGLLSRGAIYEVLRIQISVAFPHSVPWTCQTARTC
ncbi:hypothetical protein RND81_14G029500 [Saponaria officinalis]|uniref:F-box domain-containing protein n=1 Tax=Saponaria officinalis TaxID=3572 RepID=A0AAW1GL63_SAPOF